MADKKQTVYVGMSGGVDSSLTAALLVEQGYDVTGVYMKNWTQDMPGLVCPWAEDLADAKRVAVGLDIDFKVFNFEKEYKHKVVDYMIAEYQKGHTPNPDIMCNQEVKFKLFLDTALEQGADFIATGHYARVSQDNKLLRAKDDKKDQTYFLYRISKAALQKSLFPIGNYTKTEVRAMAQERGLVTATKKDSQGICFVGKVGIRDFLSHYVELRPGTIIEKETGKILGEHDGAIFYTLGQRHGLDVGGGLPLYIVGKNMTKNEIYVTTDLTDHNLWKKEMKLTDIHWINTHQEDSPFRGKKSGEVPNLQVRLRHQAALINCRLRGTTLELDEPQRAIASGQSAVLYSGQTVLGGGIIC